MPLVAGLNLVPLSQPRRLAPTEPASRTATHHQALQPDRDCVIGPTGLPVTAGTASLAQALRLAMAERSHA
jgi:hypothetical protein